MPQNPQPSGLLVDPATTDALTQYRRLASQTVASSFLTQSRDQFGGQVYNRSNATLANLSTLVGSSAIASGNRSTALGAFAYAKEDSAVSVGIYALANGRSTIAIGDEPKAAGFKSIAIGNLANATGLDGIAIGTYAAAKGYTSIAIGGSAVATQSSTGRGPIAIGAASDALGDYSVAIGESALTESTSTESVAVGSAAIVDANSPKSIAMGRLATVSTNSDRSICIGWNADVGLVTPAPSGIAIGSVAAVEDDNCIAIGDSADCGSAVTATNSIAIGFASSCQATDGVALGFQAEVDHATSMALGWNSTTTAANQVVIGHTTRSYKDWYGPNGVTSLTGADTWTLNATGGDGSNKAGGQLQFASGSGTGTATPSRVHLQGPIFTTTSGTTAQTLTDRQIWNATKTLVNSTTTSFFSVAVPNNTSAAGSVIFGIECSDATNQQQIISGTYHWAVANSGGSTNSAGIFQDFMSSVNSSGTLALVDNAVTSGTGAIFQFQASSSLTPTLLRMTYTLINHSIQAVTLL